MISCANVVVVSGQVDLCSVYCVSKYSLENNDDFVLRVCFFPLLRKSVKY